MVLDRQKMKNITIALSENYVDNIEKLQQIGMVPSRSEAIRLAIREFLKKEAMVAQLLNYKKEGETAHGE
jgi:antitoxin ParD1/3/4